MPPQPPSLRDSSGRVISNHRVLTVDAGFGHCGWAVVSHDLVLDCGCIVTEKIGKKGAVRVADSDAERCALIARELARIISLFEVQAIVAELPGGGARAARAITCMAKASAIIAVVAELLKLPAEWVTPQAVKAITGMRAATKEDVAAVVLGRWKDLPLPKTKGEQEHVLDALGAYIAAENGTMIRTLARAA